MKWKKELIVKEKYLKKKMKEMKKNKIKKNRNRMLLEMKDAKRFCKFGNILIG